MSCLRKTKPLPGRAIAIVALLVALSPAVRADSVPTPDGGHYEGPLRDGRLHGSGRIEWDSGARYRGEFERGVMSGRGRLVLPDGSVLEGVFRDGALNGEGRIEAPDGTIRSGWFRHGMLHGHGRYEGPDAVYEGSFRDGRFDGRGELRSGNGIRYRGQFKHGWMHGQGRYETPYGDIYEGDFADDRFTGKGQMTRADGARHEGEFRDWLPEGPGRFTSADGTVFEGRFEGGQLNGPASIRYPDGSHYQGETRDWQPQGRGQLAMAGGDTYTGEFSDGRFHGHGVLHFATPRDGRSEDRGEWRYGELRDPAATRARLERQEAALYSEEGRLQAALDGLQAGDPSRTELYLLTVAGDGTQEVFRRETEFVRDQFEQRFGTRGRSISLANSRQTLGRYPMASVTSIRRALHAIAARMNREQDILFLYLTSHGSPQHELSLAEAHLELGDLPARQLAALLRESGIRWRVVVVSACFSGGFIPPLQDPGTLVITAARNDRRSFGCADENDFTYFGRAFFKDALPASHSFREAFEKAERLVRERELALLGARGEVSETEFSLPQIAAPAAIRRQLERWWATLPAPDAARRRAPDAQREASARPSFSMR